MKVFDYFNPFKDEKEVDDNMKTILITGFRSGKQRTVIVNKIKDIRPGKKGGTKITIKKKKYYLAKESQKEIQKLINEA